MNLGKEQVAEPMLAWRTEAYMPYLASMSYRGSKLVDF